MNAGYAMRLRGPGAALIKDAITPGELAEYQVRLQVLACGVCRTDLHLVDGELPQAHYPITPGHEIVGRVIERGAGVTDLSLGDRVGVPWLAGSCGVCSYCRRGLENLCDNAAFTGCTLDGGYAETTVADSRYCLSIPARYTDAQAAPLLCAGLIGYRAYRAAGDGPNLGLYGFGAAAHLLAQVARKEGRRVFAFVRRGDAAAARFALDLGAQWAGGSDEMPPVALDAAILFAPAGELVPAALQATCKAGRVVCAGIHMSDIPRFPYRYLWGERSLSSVANLTRKDGRDFMRLAADVELQPSVEVFALEQANEALARLRSGKLQGAAVLAPSQSP
jgi:propanol-preferring alcohol dehydrogenase